MELFFKFISVIGLGHVFLVISGLLYLCHFLNYFYDYFPLFFDSEMRELDSRISLVEIITDDEDILGATDLLLPTVDDFHDMGIFIEKENS
ncbi:MAG: hypothetical protein ACTTJ6_03065 [Treponema sp.]